MSCSPTSSSREVLALGQLTYTKGLSSSLSMLTHMTLSAGDTTPARMAYSPTPARSSGWRMPLMGSWAAVYTPGWGMARVTLLTMRPYLTRWAVTLLCSVWIHDDDMVVLSYSSVVPTGRWPTVAARLVPLLLMAVQSVMKDSR